MKCQKTKALQKCVDIVKMDFIEIVFNVIFVLNYFISQVGNLSYIVENPNRNMNISKRPVTIV